MGASPMAAPTTAGEGGGAALRAALLGAVLGLDVIGSCLALATLIFAGPLAAGPGVGTEVFLWGTVVIGLVLATRSTVPGAIVVTQDSAAAPLWPCSSGRGGGPCSSSSSAPWRPFTSRCRSSASTSTPCGSWASCGRLGVLVLIERGGAFRVHSMTAGAQLGEVAAHLGLPRTAEGRAETPAAVLRLDAEAVARIAREDRDLAALMHQILARALADKLVRANHLLAGLRWPALRAAGRRPSGAALRWPTEGQRRACLAMGRLARGAPPAILPERRARFSAAARPHWGCRGPRARPRR